MDDEVFAFIIKYLDQGIIPKDKDTKESQVQWQKLANKYKLVEETLVLKMQEYKRIVPRSQYYPFIYCIPFIMILRQDIQDIKRYYKSFQKDIISLKWLKMWINTYQHVINAK